jgi:hypothetical protein
MVGRIMPGLGPGIHVLAAFALRDQDARLAA